MTEKMGIRELAERAKAEGAFDLAQGVIDLDPPVVLLDGLRSLPLEQVSRYDNKRGVLEYREAVVKYLASRGWQIDLDKLMSVAGVMAGISSALLTELRPGAKVLLPEPFFIAHKLLLEALGFEIVYLKTRLGEDLSWAMVEEKMKEVDGVVVTTPANPTGQVASIEVLKKLSGVAKRHNCLLLVDEMYREFIWDEKERDDSDYADLDLSNTVVLRSWSKTLAVPGWRVGFAITSPERMEKMAVSHDAMYIGGSTIAQHALAAALDKHTDKLNRYVEDLRQVLLENMEILREAFVAYGLNPLPVTATYYMLLKHERKSDMAMVEELIRKKIVATPVSILFADSKDTGYIRIHFAVRPEVARKVAGALGE